MRAFLSALLLGTLFTCGCARHRGSSGSFSEISTASNPARPWSGEKLTVTADMMLVGKVARVNMEGRFVVLTFPIGHLPALEQRLSVYRRGLKVGEIRVTGPQLDDSVVGDLAAGDAQPGDEVRAR